MNPEDDPCNVFIAIYPLRINGRLIAMNPKGLMAITKDKAEGAVKWWRNINGDQRYPCFYYDSTSESLFKEDSEALDEEKVIQKIKKFGGWVPGDLDGPFGELAR